MLLLTRWAVLLSWSCCCFDRAVVLIARLSAPACLPASPSLSLSARLSAPFFCAGDAGFPGRVPTPDERDRQLRGQGEIAPEGGVERGGSLVYGEVAILYIVYCALCSLNVGCWL